MAICASSCAQGLPDSYTGGCGIISRPGGIKRLWFIKCDFTGPLATDANWTTAQTAGDVVGSGLVMGQKAKGSFTKKRIASCMPEGITGAEKQVTFQDYNTDTVTPGGNLAYEFWNTILNESTNFRFAYETCDGHVYGPIDSFVLEIDEVIEDNNTGSTYFDGTVLWNDILMSEPTYIAGGITPA
tara:strand:+ start:3251 stop:3805 length:555 start_codon:yes stop_codon:yes gene_type:complete